jgi:5'(3')-deoxyribonucleotidase
MRKALLIDLDEVLFPFATTYHDWLIRHRGRGLDHYRLATYQLPHAAGVSEDDYYEHLDTMLNEQHIIATTPPLPGSQEALDALSSAYELLICTARHEEALGDASRAWVTQHLAGISDVICINSNDPRRTTTKGRVAAKLNAAALIDDSDSNFLDLHPQTLAVPFKRPHGLPSAPGALTWAEALPRLLRSA